MELKRYRSHLGREWITAAISLLALAVSTTTLFISHLFNPVRIQTKTSTFLYYVHQTDDVEIAIQSKELTEGLERRKMDDIAKIKDRQQFNQHHFGISFVFINSGHKQVQILDVTLVFFYSRFAHQGCEDAQSEMALIDSANWKMTGDLPTSEENSVNGEKSWGFSPLVIGPQQISVPVKAFIAINRPITEKDDWSTCLLYRIVDARGNEHEVWRSHVNAFTFTGVKQQGLEESEVLIDRWF